MSFDFGTLATIAGHPLKWWLFILQQ